jgi:hypothetical protein
VSAAKSSAEGDEGAELRELVEGEGELEEEEASMLE